MRITTTLLLSLVCVSVSIGSAEAQCYGDAAEAYGCVSSFKSEGTLERFGSGSNNGPIIIDNGSYGYGKRSPYDDLFTPEEERRMFKSAVLGATRGGSLSNGYGNRSFNANGRALRTFRGRRIGGQMFR